MLVIYNTIKHKKEKFFSFEKNRIKIYVCGVTVYNSCHLGHGRTFVIFDFIIRYLRYCGYKIYYVRNITDIDDKIIKCININNKTIKDFTNTIINKMHKDLLLLNILPPDKEPRVTHHIDEIIKMIKILISKGYAYCANNGDIMFSVKNYKNYGKLSLQNISQLKQNNKSCLLNNFKNKPEDFVLWKIAKNNEPQWNSPWGYGRPGWHIECSAISYKYLDKNFDIHGGGRDLIFPHHENEIAQSVCAIKNFHVNYWMHCGMIMIDNKKMSKSLNNFLTIQDVVKKFDPEILRYFFMSAHYRKNLNYNNHCLYQSYKSLRYLYIALRNTNNVDIKYSKKEKKFEKSFCEAMNDDFNTPKAYSVLFNIANEINKEKQKNISKANSLALKLKKLGNILGILYQNPEIFLKEKVQKDNINKLIYIEKLIKKRSLARKLKQWDKADNIRNKLKKLNIILEDNINCTSWRKEKK